MIYLLGAKPLLLGFFFAFKLNFQGGFILVFTTSAGWFNLAVFYLISLLYYTLESVSGIGIGSKIFGFRIVTKYEHPSNQMFIFYTLRNLVKSFFISNIVNALFVLAFRQDMQTLLDHRLNIILASKNDDLSKTFRKGTYSSMIMYYSSFILMTITFALENSGVSSSPASSGSSSGINVYSLFYTILTNNLSLDVTGYMLGGLSILLGTFVRLFISNILDTLVISSVFNPQELSNFAHYVLPEFFPETMGYVFGSLQQFPSQTFSSISSRLSSEMKKGNFSFL